MANDAAWQAGMDIGSKGKTSSTPDADKKKKKNTMFGKVAKSPKEYTGTIAPTPTVLHKGGTVKKTGVYRLKKGEKVLTVKQQKEAGIKTGKKKSSPRKRVACKG